MSMVDEIVEEALLYWESLLLAQRDLDRAKAGSMSRFAYCVSKQFQIRKHLFGRLRVALLQQSLNS